MLIRFAVSNFRSIRSEAEVSLTASATKELPDALVDLAPVVARGVRVLAVYGANASGKTNLIRAMMFMSNAVANSHRIWSPSAAVPVEPFILDSESRGRASRFEVDLLLAGVRYTYGFELDSVQVVSEWLFAYPNGKRQRWFERSSDKGANFWFGPNFSGENKVIQSLTRPNSLFLSAAAQNGHAQLLPLYEWFTTRWLFVNPSAREALVNTTAAMCSDPARRRAVISMLAAADLGIVDVEVTEEELDERTKQALSSLIIAVQGPGTPVQEPPKSPSFGRVPRVSLKHETIADGPLVSMRFEDESEGTRALFSLAGPVIRALDSGGTLCVDELDASLHPLMALSLVKVFNSSATNPKNAQLIFNTHDTHLLDPTLLRRDQIWFAEKDREGATHIYPLSDFQPRRGENLERGYLQGRYGAVPFVRAADFIETLDG